MRVPGRDRVLITVVLLAAMPAFAASPEPIADVWHVGPTSDVRALCHVGDALWIGTAAGLYAVDLRNGKTLAHITAGARLPSSSVRAIAAKGDSVFVGTDTGLALYRRDRTTGEIGTTLFTPAKPGRLKAVPLTRIAGLGVGENGDVLLATSGRGVGVVTPKGGGYAITRRDSLLDDKVFGVADRADGRRYFATSVGLCAQIDDTTIVGFQAGAGIPRGEVRAVIPGERNAFYLLVANHGVLRFDGMRATEVPSPKDVPLRRAASISVGSDGALWAAGDGWVFVRRGGKWTRASVPAEDAAARWRVVVADGAGAFVGSSDGRVLAVGRGGNFRVQLPAGLPAPGVASLAPDGTGAAWCLSDGKLVRADANARGISVETAPGDACAVSVSPSGEVWTAGRWTVCRRVGDAWVDMKPDVFETDPAFTALVVDRMGTWVGTRSGALYRYDGELWLRLARPSSTTRGAIEEIGAAGDGAWALAQGRAARCVDGSWSRYAGIDTATAVVDLARGPNGTWVVATEKRVLAFDPVAGKWRDAPVREWNSAGAGGLGPLEGRIRAVAFDSRGRLVLGTTEGVGLCGPDGIRWLTAADGIGGGAVADLAIDGERLWIAFAEDGVSVFSTRGLW
jgi:ligand-binding sensor domain-containing protein